MGALTFLLRLLGYAAALGAAAFVLFAILYALPGDPAAVMLGVNAPPEAVAALRHELGLDLPLILQFSHWLGALLRGDLGQSLSYHMPVATLIAERLPVTLPLAFLSLLLTGVCGLGFGIVAALGANRATDMLLQCFSLVLMSMPGFFTGLLLILLFSVRLHLLPAGGFPGWDDGLWTGLRSLLLPTLALALPQMAVLFRVTRTALLQTLNEAFMRTARMKGLPRFAALAHHAIPNALPSILTVARFQLAVLLTGSVIIENVFALPGLGRLLYQAVTQHDLPLIQGLVFLFLGVMLLVQFCFNAFARTVDKRLSDTMSYA